MCCPKESHQSPPFPLWRRGQSYLGKVTSVALDLVDQFFLRGPPFFFYAVSTFILSLSTLFRSSLTNCSSSFGGPMHAFFLSQSFSLLSVNPQDSRPPFFSTKNAWHFFVFLLISSDFFSFSIGERRRSLEASTPDAYSSSAGSLATFSVFSCDTVFRLRGFFSISLLLLLVFAFSSMCRFHLWPYLNFPTV